MANLGAILASPGIAAEGREYLQRALALDEAMGNARAQVADLANLGNASFALEEMAEALEYQTRAVSLALSLSDVDLAARTLAGRGETYEMLGQLEAARTDYAAAVERLELLRASVFEESHQIGFFAHGKPEIYQRLARVSVRLGDAMGAFVIVQKAKSRAMRALLGRSRLDPPSTADQSLLVREQALQMRLNECLANATKAPEEKKQLRWNAQAAEVAEQLKAIWEQLRASAQEYVDLRQAMPFTLFDAGRLLTTSAG